MAAGISEQAAEEQEHALLRRRYLQRQVHLQAQNACTLLGAPRQEQLRS